jgi:hypothetical protein
MSQLRDAVIVDGIRTPAGRGKPGGMANATIIERL